VTVSVGKAEVGGRRVMVGEGSTVGGMVFVGKGLGVRVGVLVGAGDMIPHPWVKVAKRIESVKTLSKSLLMFMINLLFIPVTGWINHKR